jgi:hypothetical protein
VQAVDLNARKIRCVHVIGDAIQAEYDHFASQRLPTNFLITGHPRLGR